MIILLRLDWAYVFQTFSILTLRTFIHLMSPFFFTSVTFCNDAMALPQRELRLGRCPCSTHKETAVGQQGMVASRLSESPSEVAQAIAISGGGPGSVRVTCFALTARAPGNGRTAPHAVPSRPCCLLAPTDMRSASLAEHCQNRVKIRRANSDDVHQN